MNEFIQKKAILKSSQDHKIDFKSSKCSVTISVGQSVHEQDKLKSTLIAVNEKFKSCTIMICDSLQRHSLSIYSDKPLEDIHRQANMLGKCWLQRNFCYIKKILTIDYDIIRWDYWITHPDYPEKKDIIDELALINKQFNNAIEITANSFISRNLYKLKTSELQAKALVKSREYLKEECAVMLLWMCHGYQFEIYPSHRNLAMDFVYKHIVIKENSSLVRAVSVKFKKILPQ